MKLRIRVFEDSDGYYWCNDAKRHLDTRESDKFFSSRLATESAIKEGGFQARVEGKTLELCGSGVHKQTAEKQNIPVID